MSEKSGIDAKIAGAGWGLFLVWMGASFIIKWDPGISLVGVGVIILGAQFARKINQLSYEIFWLVIGGLILVAGFSDLTGVDLPREYIFPGLLIAAGLGVLYQLMQGKNK